MKITICGSIFFCDEMLEAKRKLESAGHEIRMPPIEVKGENGDSIPVKKFYNIRRNASERDGWVWNIKGEAIMNHFKKIEWCDAILVLNMDKSGVKGYIGSNMLMEMGVAFFLGKKIYLLNQIPVQQSREEILGMKPAVLNGNLKNIF